MADEIKYGILVKLRDNVSGALGKLQGKLKKFSKSVDGASRTARRGLLGVAAGVGAIVYAAAEQEKADIALAAALRSSGDASEETFQRFKDLADAIQDVTTYGDEATQEMIAMALNLGISTDKMDETIKGAIGLSEALGMDMQTALRYTALAMQGEYTVLQRYVPALRAAKDPAEKLAIVQELMAKGFDQAKEKAEGLEGRLSQLKNRFGDLLQAIGMQIFGTEKWGDAVAAIEEKIKGAIDWIRNLTTEQKENILTMIKWSVGILAAIAVLGPLSQALAALTTAIIALSTPLGATIASLAILAIALLLVTDAVGLTDTGLLKLAQSFEPLDWMFATFAEGFMGTAELLWRTMSQSLSNMRSFIAGYLELREKLVGWVPGVHSVEELIGIDPKKIAKDLRDANKEAKTWRELLRATRGSERALMWQGYYGRHPGGKAPDELATPEQRAAWERSRARQNRPPEGGPAGPGAAEAKAAAQGVKNAAKDAGGTAEEVKILSETIVPLLTDIMEDDKITKEELKRLSKTLSLLARARS